MKHIFTFLMLSYVMVANAQFQLGFNYMFSAPIGTLGENIQPVNSFAMSGAANLKANKHFFLGGELSFGTYAHAKQQQTFVSPGDGSPTTTDVDFNSNIYNYHAIGGYEFTLCTNVIPYVTAKIGGSSFATEIIIQDPQDPHSCEPLDQQTVFKDAAFSAGAGAGVRVDAGSIFNKSRKGRVWFNFSADYLWGTSLDYINVKYLSPDQQSQNLVSREVTTRFVDVRTNEIHEHHIAQVYNSSINLFNFKIGLIRTFGGCSY